MTMEDDKVKKKINDGWIKSWMMVEVLAVEKDAAEESLKQHIDKLRKENKTEILKADFQAAEEVDNPLPNVAKAYSQVVELELLTENFEKLMFITMNYGPSALEILEPSQIRMDMGEAQGILNSISEMIHRFAAAGIGGLVINR